MEKPVIAIINGPNLNLTGRREPHIYGTQPLGQYLDGLHPLFPGHEIVSVQSNHEGEIIDALQQFGDNPSIVGIVLNAGAYSHTSLAIADAVAAIATPVVEVHISNIYAREEIRRRSLLSPVCRGCIAGLGLEGYHLAVQYLACGHRQ